MVSEASYVFCSRIVVFERQMFAFDSAVCKLEVLELNFVQLHLVEA